MNCSGVWSSGTAYITFEDVSVPKTHLIGKENNGFKVSYNFIKTWLQTLSVVYHVQLQSCETLKIISQLIVARSEWESAFKLLALQECVSKMP